MPTDFLYAAGTSNSGLLGSVLTLQSTELNSLASGSLIVSSVGGASGKFTNNDTAQGIFADLFLTLGAIGTALSAGANVAGWFLDSPDSGTTYESLTAQPARPPDFIIPLPATTISGGTVFAAHGIVLSALQFKVLVMNNSGQTFASSANTLKLAASAIQY
jgi:hypothetical protein